ncbi:MULTISPECIES: hypothetical protein [unclassified Mycolicibacterium]|uniref:hypothetical protein n=1 Tax=unclassified Mycolicibacterium TaxID=2636767 RepID=UPI002ED8A16B
MVADPPAGEWATARGIEILDELCLTLLECRVVLRNVQSDVGLTLDELDRDLGSAQYSARLAHSAAVLLCEGAAMVESWSRYPARPKAVHARHQVAVERGAVQISPTKPTADRYEEILRRPDGAAAPAAPPSGRRCATYLKQAGKPCRRRRVRIDSDELADHCVYHLNAMERHRYERYLKELESLRQTARQSHSTKMSTIAAEWIDQRRKLHGWFRAAIGVGEEPTR